MVTCSVTVTSWRSSTYMRRFNAGPSRSGASGSKLSSLMVYHVRGSCNDIPAMTKSPNAHDNALSSSSVKLGRRAGGAMSSTSSDKGSSDI